MTQLLFASHGPLAAAMLASTALIAGKEKTEPFHVIHIELSTPVAEVRNEIDQFFDSIDDNDDVLALTDVYGGSITTVLTEYIGIRRLRIVSGMNLGMALEAIFAKDLYAIDQLASILVENGKLGIRDVNAELECERGEEI